MMMLLCISRCLVAGPVEYIEDAYAMPAPQDIVEQVERVAQLMDFTEPYELGVPKKAGIDINPWNRYIAHCINPQTQRPFLLINPAWFNQLDQGERTFLIARCFGGFKESIAPGGVKAIPYLHMLVAFLMIILLFILLNRAQIIKQRWLTVLVAYIIVSLCNLMFLNDAQTRLISYLGRCHDTMIHKMVIERTGDKDTAMRALMRLDQAIKQEVAQGDPFWQPFVDIFEKRAQGLKST